jgi:disulfide bond formation protein DsbB
MEWVALSIFVCTVLALVNANRAWPAFWRFMKLAGTALVVIAIGLGAYFYAEEHQARKSLTPDEFMSQQSNH